MHSGQDFGGEFKTIHRPPRMASRKTRRRATRHTGSLDAAVEAWHLRVAAATAIVLHCWSAATLSKGQLG